MSDTIQRLMGAAESKPIGARENRLLARRMRAGDKAARQEMIERNLPLVLYNLNSLSYRAPDNMAVEDIFCEAVAVLIAAVDQYNPDSWAFSTYATTSMHRTLPRRLAAWDRNGTASRGTIESAWSYQNLVAAAKSMNLPLDPDSIASRFDQRPDHCHQMQAVLDILPARSLSMAIRNNDSDSGYSHIDNLQDPTDVAEAVEDMADAEHLDKALACLSNDQAKVIRARFIEHRTLASVAKEMCLERIDVRRIERGALRSLASAYPVRTA